MSFSNLSVGLFLRFILSIRIVFCLHVWGSPWSLEKGIVSTGPGVIGDCELRCVLGVEPGPLAGAVIPLNRRATSPALIGLLLRMLLFFS